MTEPNEFKVDDPVVVAAADPNTRVRGIVKSAALPSADGKLYFVHWDDGVKSWWPGSRLELHNNNNSL